MPQLIFKNSDDQYFYVIAIDQNGRVEDDEANITCTVAIDGDEGNRAALDDVNPEPLGAGMYRFLLIRDETNGNVLVFQPASATPGVDVLGDGGNVVPTVILTRVPERANESLEPVIIGDDYTEQNLQPFVFEVEAPPNTDENSTCQMIFNGGAASPPLAIDGTITAISGGLRLLFELTAAQGRALGRGSFRFAVKIKATNGDITTVRYGSLLLDFQQIFNDD